VFHLKELSDHGIGPRHLIKVVMVAIREVEGAIKRKRELGETLVKAMELGLGRGLARNADVQDESKHVLRGVLEEGEVVFEDEADGDVEEVDAGIKGVVVSEKVGELGHPSLEAISGDEVLLEDESVIDFDQGLVKVGKGHCGLVHQQVSVTVSFPVQRLLEERLDHVAKPF
jgi:hypothetical protein